jgi:hypothetical protein
MGAFPQPDGLGTWLVGGAIKSMLSVITSTVDAGAAEALRLTGSMLSSTTSPGLLSTWFSATYWRVAALSAVLTVPFLFAAAVHALVRSDLALLGRAAFGYLPLGAIGVTIAAPLATLLLSATDEMCTVVAGAAGNADAAALGRAASGVVALSAMTGNPMLAFFIGLLALAATIGLWIELLIRAAAVDMIVLMLPLFFAAMVWPARRVWAIRAIETLIALILAKFAIVAVLTLGGAAFGGQASSLGSTLVGATLIVLAVFSPWALLRVLPLHEVAAAAAGGLSAAPHDALRGAGRRALGGLRGGGDASESASEAGGPGAEDDAEQAMAHTAAFDAGLRDVGGATNGAAWWPSGRGSASTVASRPAASRSAASRPFDAETAQGLAAVNNQGRHAAHGGNVNRPAASYPPETTVLAQAAHDDRPPINDAFRPGEWDGFVLGEEGDEVMEPPRFVGKPDFDGDGGADPLLSTDEDAPGESA